MKSGVVANSHVRRFMLMFSLLLGPMAWADAVSYSDATDAELQAIGARWETLDQDERRALLTEINRRMVAAGKHPVLRIRAERRYGYRVRQPDGSVVQIERREGFVRYQELDPEQPFGVGFEQRAGLVPVPADKADAASVAAGDKKAPAEDGPVPRASRVPVYQLPIREVHATEPQQ